MHPPHFSSSRFALLYPLTHHTLALYAPPSELQDLLPGIINQLGPDNLEDLKKIYSSSLEGAAGGDVSLRG